MKPPVCTVCHRPHWRNQDCLGSPSDWNTEFAVALGKLPEGAEHLTEPVTLVTDVTHESNPKARLLAFLSANPDAEQATIKKGVKARWQDVRRALTDLLELGAVSRRGSGKRNSGYRYTVGN